LRLAALFAIFRLLPLPLLLFKQIYFPAAGAAATAICFSFPATSTNHKTTRKRILSGFYIGLVLLPVFV